MTAQSNSPTDQRRTTEHAQVKEHYILLQQKIIRVKERFSAYLMDELNLTEVQAPLLTDPHQGTQDSLSGYEQAVPVNVKSLGREFEVVHSLAKWKRSTLGAYKFSPGEGILTQMKALRPDEDKLTPLHSVYVDQWDWEQVISPDRRTAEQLQRTARAVYRALQQTLESLHSSHGSELQLPSKLTFVSSEALRKRYPDLSPKARERAITQEHRAVFISGIGAALKDGYPHDVRAPDYDDWSSMDEHGMQGLNGDLLVWSDVLQDAIELSSMGIRVNPEALLRQLKLAGRPEVAHLPWHQSLLNDHLPQTVGGGIGQSRVCMFLLEQPHIGCVQVGVWPQQDYLRYPELLS